MAYAAFSVVFGEQPSAAKWNILGTNDASFHDGTGIAAGAISKPEQLVIGAGTSWAWQSWTPTWTNFTVSSSTVTAKYIQIGKTVHFRLVVVLAGGNVPGSGPLFSLPITSVSYAGSAQEIPIGVANMLDKGTASFPAHVFWNSTTTAMVNVHRTDATYAFNNNISATVPHTWANTDEFHAQGTYEAA